jgi:hypothetical protein
MKELKRNDCVECKTREYRNAILNIATENNIPTCSEMMITINDDTYPDVRFGDLVGGTSVCFKDESYNWISGERFVARMLNIKEKEAKVLIEEKLK